MKTLAKWSIAEYHQMIEAGILNEKSVELIAGEIVEMIPETPLHYNTAWVLDLAGKQINVFRHPQENDYLDYQIWSQGKLASLAFPDLQISLEKLF